MSPHPSALRAARHNAHAQLDGPLTAERAMLDQIRFKLERTQRRLARTSSSSSSGYGPCGSGTRGHLKENDTTTRSQPATRRYPSGHQLPQQYKSKSKFAHVDRDPLNGGPPPLSTPYLVYSDPRSRATEANVATDACDPSRSSGVARPPTSRVRFQGDNDPCELLARPTRDVKQRWHQHVKDREARHKLRASSGATAARDAVARATPEAVTRTSPSRRIVQTVPPPTSNINTSAFDELVPRRRAATRDKGGPRETGREPAPCCENEDGDTSTYATDDSYDVDSESELEIPVAHKVRALAALASHAQDGGTELPRSRAHGAALTSRVTTKDLARYALGRTSNCAQSDRGPSASAPTVRAPKSDVVAPCAVSCARTTQYPTPTGQRTTGLPASVATYIRRSRLRAPLDLKHQLPPSIGVLSGLSSGSSTFGLDPSCFYHVAWTTGEFAFSVQHIFQAGFEVEDRKPEHVFLRMLLNTERSTCKSFDKVRVGDVLIRVGDVYVSELGLEGSGSVLTKFFAKLMAQLPVHLTFQRMKASDWDGGVEL